MPIQTNDQSTATWTTGWSTFEPFELGGAPHYLAYKIDTGQISIDRIRPDGSGVDTIFGDTWSTGWTSLVPFVLGGQPTSLEYKVDTGQVSIDRIRADGSGVDTLYTDTWSTGWTSFMPFVLGDRPCYLAYKVDTGQVTIDRIKEDGSGVETLYGDTWSTGWTSFVPFVVNGQPHYLCYKRDSGDASIDRIQPDGSSVEITRQSWTTGWTAFAPFVLDGDTHYLGYKSATGEATVDRIRADASGVDTQLSATWSTDWSTVICFANNGAPSYLVYKSTTGDVAIGTFASSGSTTVTPTSSGKVRSSNIQVGGKHFVDWFNDDFRPTQPGMHPTIRLYNQPTPKYPMGNIPKAAFNTVFDACATIWAPELTINQFVTFFCIIDNETGATFLPISEMGSEKYMFEKTAGGKASYNGPPNRPAGDLLKERGVISDDADVEAWNSRTTYPAPTDETLKAAAHECDFYKFRGRGLVQLTWRSAYLQIVDPLLVANGYSKCDDLAQAELGRIIRADSRIYLPMLKGVFRAKSKTFPMVDNTPPDWAAFGTSFSGTSVYGELLQFRCSTLLDAMVAAGYTCA